MSKYTTEVRFICENYSGLTESKGQADVNTIIANSREKIFDFSYPIYDEEYRSVLETKILKHFYTREIGCETVGLWKLWLDTKMNEIMPYYNQLYNSTLLEFNPLYDVDYTTDRDRNGSGNISNNTTGTSNATSTDTDDKWRYYSDTPQGGINGLSSNTYLTNATHETGTYNGNTSASSTGSTTGNYTDTEDYLEHVTGKRNGTTYSKMLEEYRDTFLNIDMQVIHELDELFLNLW